MDLSPELFAKLYSAAPEDFLTVRGELVAEAKQGGDADLARRIAAQRKPTLSAWIVNRQVHAEPDCVEQLLDLGSRLRVATDDLDASGLRDLSTERRALVADLTSSALTRTDRADPQSALRDDVTSTFDAAVADPQIAARLGRLTRPEHWSGFGVAMDASSGPPELTVIRGGRGRSTSARTSSTASSRTPTTATEPPANDPPRADAAARRRARKTRDKAADAFDAAEAELRSIEDGRREASERVHDLGAELSRIQAELDKTKQYLEGSRREVKSARNRRREARSALDRAERQVERTDD